MYRVQPHVHNFPELWIHRVVCGPSGPGCVPVMPRGHINPPASIPPIFPSPVGLRPKSTGPGLQHFHSHLPWLMDYSGSKSSGPLHAFFSCGLPSRASPNPSVCLGRPILVTISLQNTERAACFVHLWALVTCAPKTLSWCLHLVL